MPKVSSRKKAICKVGDRIQSPTGLGTIRSTSHGSILPYEIEWENGKFSYHKGEDFKLQKFVVLESVPESKKESGDQLGIDFKEQLIRLEKCSDNCSDKIFEDDQLTIFSLIEQGVGDTTRLSAKTGLGMSAIAQQLRELSEQGKIHRVDYQWKIKNSDSLTSAQGLALDSPSQDSNLDLPLLVYANERTIAEISSRSDTQEFPLLQTLSDTIGRAETDTVELQTSTLSPLPLPASLSVSKGRDLGPTTSEIVFPRSSKRSPKPNRCTSRSKTSEESLPAHTDQGTGKELISKKLDVTFSTWGSDLNGELLVRDILDAPSLESGSFWLASPNALSSRTSRRAGQSKLERQLKAERAIAPNENVNPTFLEDAFEIPLGWSDPLESRTAAELIAVEEKPLAMPLTPELPPLLSNECSTSTLSGKTEEELTPVDKEAIGKHYWCDAYDVAVEVLSIRMWRVEGKLVKGADTRPWWTRGIPSNYCYGDSLVVPLDELVEVEQFSCPLPKPDSREKFEFYVTVPAGIERPSLMPTDLCYLFVASSFWNRSRAKQPSFPRCPKFPQGVKKGADSGGYIAAKEWGGKYPYSPDQYVEWLSQWKPDWAATMDYPCEPPLTGGDRSRIRHRQKQTTKLAWHFWNNYRDVPWQWLPTIQGWDTEDYVFHAQQLKPLIEEMRQHYGESFRVGIGTLCGRASNKQIQEIVEAVSNILPGVWFHLWGVKQDAAPIFKFLPQVISSDSAAWDGLAGSSCRKVWEEQYKGKISQAEYRWTIALPKYLDKLEGKLGVPGRSWGDPNSLEQPRTHASKQIGSLYQYTKNKADQTGTISTHPKVQGDRKREEDSHWYWGFSYVEKEKGKWKDKSASVSRPKLSAVREALREGKHYTYILREILGKDG